MDTSLERISVAHNYSLSSEVGTHKTVRTRFWPWLALSTPFLVQTERHVSPEPTECPHCSLNLRYVRVDRTGEEGGWSERGIGPDKKKVCIILRSRIPPKS